MSGDCGPHERSSESCGVSRDQKSPDPFGSGLFVFCASAYYAYRREALGRTCSKQELQYTGLSPRGWNGTRASWPQLLHVAV